MTTPQEVSLLDARKAIAMFSKVNVRTLGVIENMSGFVCPDCGHEHDIFGSGGGEKIARELELDVLGRIPLEPGVRAGGDAGVPITSAQYPGGEDSRRGRAARGGTHRCGARQRARCTGAGRHERRVGPKVPRITGPGRGIARGGRRPENRRHAHCGDRRHPCQPASIASRHR